jgi:hypothetical protein
MSGTPGAMRTSVIGMGSPFTLTRASVARTRAPVRLTRASLRVTDASFTLTRAPVARDAGTRPAHTAIRPRDGCVLHAYPGTRRADAGTRPAHAGIPPRDGCVLHAYPGIPPRDGCVLHAHAGIPPRDGCVLRAEGRVRPADATAEARDTVQARAHAIVRSRRRLARSRPINPRRRCLGAAQADTAGTRFLVPNRPAAPRSTCCVVAKNADDDATRLASVVFPLGADARRGRVRKQRFCQLRDRWQHGP